MNSPTEAIIVFACQFSYIFLLGFQQLNVQHSNYGMAALTSLTLGVIGYHITATIAIHAEAGASESSGYVRAGYYLAGPVAICVAMWVHPRMRAWFGRGGK